MASPGGSPRATKRAARTPSKALVAEELKPPAASLEHYLPDECLVEVLRSLELCELLSSAWVCRRWHSVAQDESLWKRTRFSSCEASVLLRHFTPNWRTRHSDHTGIWTKCTQIGRASCRERV